MSLFAPLTNLSYAEWDAELEHTRGLCGPYEMDTPDGRALNPEICPGPLAKRFDLLITYGLERGWLQLDHNGQPTTGGEGS